MIAPSYFLAPECHASKLNEMPPLNTRLAAFASCCEIVRPMLPKEARPGRIVHAAPPPTSVRVRLRTSVVPGGSSMVECDWVNVAVIVRRGEAATSNAPLAKTEPWEK